MLRPKNLDTSTLPHCIRLVCTEPAQLLHNRPLSKIFEGPKSCGSGELLGRVRQSPSSAHSPTPTPPPPPSARWPYSGATETNFAFEALRHSWDWINFVEMRVISALARDASLEPRGLISIISLSSLIACLYSNALALGWEPSAIA